MSRWAETFAALSAHDTSDTSDNRSGAGRATGPSVASVKRIETIEETSETALKAAETLDFREPVEPSVPSVTSVTSVEDGGGSGLGKAVPWSSGAADTSSTLATQADSFGAKVPRRWAEGYAALCSMTPPGGFSPERWQRIVDATCVLLDRWAATAIEAGWSTIDVFGCNPDRPDARFDAMGLVLLLDRCEVVELDEKGADLVTKTGARQRFRRRPLPQDTVPLWNLADNERGRDAG